MAPGVCEPSQTGGGEARIPWKVGVVLPDSAGKTQFAQSEALGRSLLCDLQPGDSLIVVRESTFEVVVSEVVPGDRSLVPASGDCEDIPVGGPSQHCLRIAEGEQALDAWRLQVLSALSRVTPVNGPEPACSRSSGWPRDHVLQLLFALQPDPGVPSYSWLIVSGDADARDGEPALDALLADVHLVVAPYVFSCGDPEHIRDWFGGALAIDLYPIERPASLFAAFLRSHATGDVLSAGGPQ